MLGFRILGAQFALVVAGTGGREGESESESERVARRRVSGSGRGGGRTGEEKKD